MPKRTPKKQERKHCRCGLSGRFGIFSEKIGLLGKATKFYYTLNQNFCSRHERTNSICISRCALALSIDIHVSFQNSCSSAEFTSNNFNNIAARINASNVFWMSWIQFPTKQQSCRKENII